MQIYLIERDELKFAYLKKYFESEDVILVHDSFQNFMRREYVQCVVSPANSFGIMDGGYDLAITHWFGEQLPQRVQEHIVEHYYGEQPVGSSFLIEAGYDGQYLIHTPTMQTPQRIEDPRVIYQCMRSTLIEAKNNDIESILIPMFGGSCGQVEPKIVAYMMWRAYRQMQSPPDAITWRYAYDQELLLEDLYDLE